MKTLYMETTKKSPEQTGAEIENVLKNYGLSKFMKDYKDGEIIGCVFAINIDGKEVPMKLPVNWKPLLSIADKGETKYIKPGDATQAKRVAWRQVFRWVEAQLSLVEIGMVKIQEVFLPYMLINQNQTLFELMESNNYKMIEQRKENENKN